jgi:hypothetical protein
MYFARPSVIFHSFMSFMATIMAAFHTFQLIPDYLRQNCKTDAEDIRQGLINCYMENRKITIEFSELVRVILVLIILAILFFFGESAFIALNDQRTITYQALLISSAVYASLLTLLFFTPILWLNGRAAVLEYEISQNPEIPYATKHLLTELVREYPIYFGILGFQLTLSQFLTVLASLAVPALTKGLQYLSK